MDAGCWHQFGDRSTELRGWNRWITTTRTCAGWTWAKKPTTPQLWTRPGKRLFDVPLPHDEAELRQLFADLSKHGPVQVIVDQPNTIGAPPVAVARESDWDVAYLPGLAMRRMADLRPGTAKTATRDGYVIADAGPVMPHAVRPVSSAKRPWPS